jgi:SulP family sulfate permease
MRVVEAHARVRDLLRAEGLEEEVGYLGRHMSVDQAIVEFQANEPAKQPNQTTRPVTTVPVIG